jgi:hypothetical protein
MHFQMPEMQRAADLLGEDDRPSQRRRIGTARSTSPPTLTLPPLVQLAPSAAPASIASSSQGSDDVFFLTMQHNATQQTFCVDGF